MADTVLIVDDDEAVLTMLYKVIRSNGIEADTVASGEEALERTAQRTYDLILLDVNLMGMDGFQVVQTLRQRGVRTPIIIVSGRKEDYDTLYGLDIGADDYVTKPFNPVTLGAKVKALIRRSRNGLPGADSLITAGPFTYNTSTLRFYKNVWKMGPAPAECGGTRPSLPRASSACTASRRWTRCSPRRTWWPSRCLKPPAPSASLTRRGCCA